MKRHLSTIIILAMFIVGLSVLLYPAISEYINSRHASKVIAMHNEAVEKAAKKELDQIWHDATDYNKRLANDPGAFFAPERIKGYDKLLDISGAGIMGYIDIDRIKAELPIYHGTDKGVLQIGVGHLEGTSLPVGGESTHCVLSGHRGLPDRMAVGDHCDIAGGDTDRISLDLFRNDGFAGCGLQLPGPGIFRGQLSRGLPRCNLDLAGTDRVIIILIPPLHSQDPELFALLSRCAEANQARQDCQCA